MSEKNKPDDEYADRIKILKKLIRQADFEDAIKEFNTSQLQKADEALRLYGANSEATNADMPDRMIGWFKLIYEMEEE